MPHSQYIPGHEPPSIADRILAHPFVVPLAVVLFGCGVLAGMSAITNAAVSRALEEAPLWVELLIGLPLMAGAAITLYGAINPSHRVSRLTAMAVERTGSALLASGTLGYGLLVMFSGNPFGAVTAWLGIGVGVGYLLRAVALAVSERRVRGVLEKEQQNRGVADGT